MTLNTFRFRALRRAPAVSAHNEQDNSLIFMLLLLLLLVFGPVIGVHVAFVLQEEQSSAQTAQHKELGRDTNG